MIRYYRENDCVGCEDCRGCGRKEGYWEAELTCDRCGNEVEELYEDGADEICEDCLKQDNLKITYAEALKEWEEQKNDN